MDQTTLYNILDPFLRDLNFSPRTGSLTLEVTVDFQKPRT